MESVESPEDRNYRFISFAEYGDLTLIPGRHYPLAIGAGDQPSRQVIGIAVDHLDQPAAGEGFREAASLGIVGYYLKRHKRITKRRIAAPHAKFNFQPSLPLTLAILFRMTALTPFSLWRRTSRLCW